MAEAIAKEVAKEAGKKAGEETCKCLVDWCM